MKETVRIVDIKDVKVFNEAVKLAQTAARRAREDDSWLAACNSSLVSAFPWNWGDRNWLEVYTEALHAKKAAAMDVGDLVWVNPPEIESGIGDAGIFEEVEGKTLSNTTASQAKDNVKDIQFWGNGDTFKLISKASSAREGWMKSTKAMEVPGVGCVVQVTTQQGDNVAEAVVFVPGTRVVELKGPDGDVVSRSVERDTNIL